MYFSIKSDIPHLSYILVKNPNSPPFEQDLRGLKFTGQFVNGVDTQYEIKTELDDMQFLKVARQLNLDFYLNSEVAAACPYHLKALWETLRSCIAGRPPKGDITDEQFFQKTQNQEIIIGPIVNDLEFSVKLFDDYNINASSVESTIEMRSCFMLKLNPKEAMTTSEFIQKAYVLSLFLTIRRGGIYTAHEAFVDKLITISKTWLDEGNEDVG
jgi:hypothetical protein